jgi:hypothetical protein
MSTPPTIKQYFGTDSVVLTDILNYTGPAISAQNPVLVIPFSSFADMKMTNPASMEFADAIFYAFLDRVRLWTRADVEEASMVEAADPALSLSNRAGYIVEVLSYSVNIFKARSQVIAFDPDDIRPLPTVP